MRPDSTSGSTSGASARILSISQTRGETRRKRLFGSAAPAGSGRSGTSVQPLFTRGGSSIRHADVDEVLAPDEAVWRNGRSRRRRDVLEMRGVWEEDQMKDDLKIGFVLFLCWMPVLAVLLLLLTITG